MADILSGKENAKGKAIQKVSERGMGERTVSMYWYLTIRTDETIIQSNITEKTTNLPPVVGGSLFGSVETR